MSKRREEENIGSFYMGRMRPPPKPQRVLPKGLLTTVCIAAFAIIIWYAYPQGQEKYTGLDIPVIKADTAPYKFKPDDPGGMEVLHQDSTVFDPLERRAEKVEKLLPQPEKPVDKTAAIDKKIEAEKPPKLNLDMQMKPVAENTEKVVTKKEAAKLAKEAKAAEAKEAKLAAAAKTPEKKPAAVVAPVISKTSTLTSEDKSIVVDKKEIAPSVDTKPVEKAMIAQAAKDNKKAATAAKAAPAVKPADKKLLAKEAAKPVPPAPVIPDVVWDVWVRVGSYRTVSGANDDWNMLRKKYPQYLGKLEMRTAKIDLGAKGIFYRLEAGRVSDARAREICKDLSKLNPGGCIVVK